MTYEIERPDDPTPKEREERRARKLELIEMERQCGPIPRTANAMCFSCRRPVSGGTCDECSDIRSDLYMGRDEYDSYGNWIGPRKPRDYGVMPVSVAPKIPPLID